MNPNHIRWTFVLEQTQRILQSYHHWLKKDLIPRQGSKEDQALALFKSYQIVLSSDLSRDPLLNYGNQKALDLWEMSWEELTNTPGRLTAEADERSKREKFLETVRTQGFIQNYEGIRISKTGKRFFIKNVTVWNLLNAKNEFAGQAATFTEWKMLE